MKFIGQKELLQTLVEAKESGFPLFTILVGPRGGGKKSIAHMISAELKTATIDAGASVADVRTVIVNSYKVKAPTTYIFGDADKMSGEAKSALLKITEEPPNHCYFIMTLENLASVPSTIASRAAVYYLNRYTPQELKQYAHMIEVDDVVCNFCDTPGDVEMFKTMDINSFVDYVALVVDNVAQVGTANSLKIGDRIALKDDAEGYDLKLFWKAFIDECLQRAEQELPKRIAFDYASGATLTSKYLAELRVRGTNKSMLFLDWVLQIRKEWK